MGGQADGPARDLFAGADGKAHVYYGTAAAALKTLDSATSSWSTRTYPEWSIVNNLSFGGFAVFEKHIFVTDMAAGAKVDQGIIQFDLSGGLTARFTTEDEHIDPMIRLKLPRNEPVSSR